VISFLRSFFGGAISFPQGGPFDFLLVYDICNRYKIPLGFHQTFVLSTKQGEGGNMTAQDRREFVRISVDIPTEFIVEGGLYQGRIKNIN